MQASADTDLRDGLLRQLGDRAATAEHLARRLGEDYHRVWSALKRLESEGLVEAEPDYGSAFPLGHPRKVWRRP